MVGPGEGEKGGKDARLCCFVWKENKQQQQQQKNPCKSNSLNYVHIQLLLEYTLFKKSIAWPILQTRKRDFKKRPNRNSNKNYIIIRNKRNKNVQDVD